MTTKNDISPKAPESVRFSGEDCLTRAINERIDRAYQLGLVMGVMKTRSSAAQICSSQAIKYLEQKIDFSKPEAAFDSARSTARADACVELGRLIRDMEVTK